MIKVYFESSAHSELVAVFATDALYMACLPALEEKAKEGRMIVTESDEEADAGIDGEMDEERVCRNCGKDCTRLGGWYHELDERGDTYHCDFCHSKLYTVEEWANLCEENPDEYYWTE